MAWQLKAFHFGIILFGLVEVSFSQTNNCNSVDAFTIALLGGPKASEGRLEIYYRGQWGTVCKDNFSATEARAVCRSLGFYGGKVVTCVDEVSKLEDDDSKPIWMSNVNCTRKWWFQDCTFSSRQQHSCDHSKDVYISCLPEYYCQESSDANACEDEQAHKPKTLKTSKLLKLASLSDKSSFKKDLLDPLLVVRDVGSPGHRNAREHIVGKMQGLGWSVEQDQFIDNTPLGAKTFTNIIATQNLNAARRLVFACHYDSKYFTSQQFIGMSDSSVPCAMLLDLGKTLDESLKNPRGAKGNDVSLQFIFFDGEEAFVSWTNTDSIYGARHLATKWDSEFFYGRERPPVNTNQRIDAFVLLDLIGYRNPQFKNWFSSTKKLFERLQKIESRLDKEGQLSQKESYQSPDSSRYFTGSLVTGGFNVQDDHVPFLQRGVPILHLIAYPFPPVWHQAGDNGSNYDSSSVDDLLKIFRVFIAEYLHLNP